MENVGPSVISNASRNSAVRGVNVVTCFNLETFVWSLFHDLAIFSIEILYALKSSLAKPSKQLQNFPRTPAPPLHTVFWRSFLVFWQTFKKNMFYLMNVDFNARKNMFTLRKDEILPPTGNPRLHTVFWRSFLGFLALGNSSDWHLQTHSKKQ